jgi:protoporphyrinogen oxidase
MAYGSPCDKISAAYQQKILRLKDGISSTIRLAKRKSGNSKNGSKEKTRKLSAAENAFRENHTARVKAEKTSRPLKKELCRKRRQDKRAEKPAGRKSS